MALFKMKNKKSSTKNDKKKLTEKRSLVFDNKNIFNKFDPGNLGDTLLDQSIKNYDHSIYYIYKGKLNSGSEYALLIGTSNKWINVFTLTKAKEPTYDVFGYNIYEKRWSYGSNILGAKEFRDIIDDNNSEIIKLMNELTPIRIEKEKEKKKRIAGEEKSEKKYEKELKKEENEIKSAQKYFSKLMTDEFASISFEFNKNKTNLASALNEASKHYYDIDIINQTCNCPNFKSDRYKYELNDIRRLCPHLFYIIKQRNILKKNNDKLDQFILENFKSGVLGILKKKIENELPFAIIIYNWSKSTFVATPKTNKDGFQMIEWKNEKKEWIPSRGGKKINEQIKPILEKYFPK